MSSKLSSTALSDLATRLVPVIRSAGDLIMDIYRTDFDVTTKGDASPVTEADERAEALILAELKKLDRGHGPLLQNSPPPVGAGHADHPDVSPVGAGHARDPEAPVGAGHADHPDASPVGAGHARDSASESLQNIPIIAEEAVAAGKIPEVAGTFWLVDPLDGTKEFISKNGEFTVNIALIVDGKPVLGLVYAPAIDQLYVGVEGQGAYLLDAEGRHAIAAREVPEEGLTAVVSRSHNDAQALEKFLSGRKLAHTVSAGSSLKLCLVAAGQADLYPRLGRTMEWDIAAGHAVLSAAGGVLTELDGKPFLYGKPDFANPHFVAWGKTSL